MIDISTIIGITWYEIITKTDGTQVVMYSPLYIANAVLTILFYVGIFILLSNLQKSFSRGAKK